MGNSNTSTLSGVIVVSDLSQSSQTHAGHQVPVEDNNNHNNSLNRSENTDTARYHGSNTSAGSSHMSSRAVAVAGGQSVRVLNLEVSSEKKDRAHMHGRWSSDIFPSLQAFVTASTTSTTSATAANIIDISSSSPFQSSSSSTFSVDGIYQENGSFILLCCKDWSVATVLLSALLLQLYPQFILTNRCSSIIESESTSHSNEQSVDPANYVNHNTSDSSNNSASVQQLRHWTKNDIKFTLSILQQCSILLQCSRMLMKELSSYFVKT